MSEIVYEDNHIIVAVKPPNQLTQGDETGDLSLLDELKGYIKVKYSKPGEVYLGLVHRLDRPVGGLVAFARTSKAASRLSEQLRSHKMAREYLAVISNGAKAPDSCELRDWLIKDEAAGRVHVLASPAEGAKEARLSYKVLARHESTALLHVTLQTGRKHQIRAQLAHAGYPLMYDMRYGSGTRGQNVALWGAALALEHPTLKKQMIFTSSPRGEAFAPYEEAIAEFIGMKGENAQ